MAEGELFSIFDYEKNMASKKMGMLIELVVKERKFEVEFELSQGLVTAS